MPNKNGGKNYKRGKKGSATVKVDEPLATEDFHRYAQVEKKLGGTRLLLNCSDGEKRQGIIRGKMVKRVWMNPGDVILVEINPELNKSHKSQECYIVHKYSPHAIQNLKSQGEIDFEVKDNTDTSDIVFGETENKLESYDDIYKEMDKLDSEETKEDVTDKEKQKRVLRVKGRETDKKRQQDRLKKERGNLNTSDLSGPIDIDSI